MEIAVYFFDRVSFLNENSIVKKAVSVEKTDKGNNVKLDEDSNTSLSELYKQGYRLINVSNDLLFLERPN